jgi:hypothetical protein
MGRMTLSECTSIFLFLVSIFYPQACLPPIPPGTPALTPAIERLPKETREQPGARPRPRRAQPDAETNAFAAAAQLKAGGEDFEIVVLSDASTGIEAEIYENLLRRNYRATTGADEGFDVSGQPCWPRCIYLRRDALDAVPVESWVRVLKHESRHVLQAKNNPNLARDFRGADRVFTTYAAFMEACADDGIGVGPLYKAAERLGNLKLVLGAQYDTLVVPACIGERPAFDTLVEAYNRLAGVEDAFLELFPPYK